MWYTSLEIEILSSIVEETDGMILPTWTAADQTTVKTSREVWEGVRADGWHVEVFIHHLS